MMPENKTNSHNNINFTRKYKQLPDRELGFKITKNIDFVTKNHLCHGCGTCAAVCPHNAIQFNYDADKGTFLPKTIPNKCVNCELCVSVCSGFELDLNAWNNQQTNPNTHGLIGPYTNIYRSYTTNSDRRKRAASGGMVTEIVQHLLEEEGYDGAILTRTKHNTPMQAESYIARNKNDLLESQNSKYCPITLNLILKDFIHDKTCDEKYVFVGLPHHIHGLRLVQKLYPHMTKVFPCLISIFTSHVPSQKATEFILYKNNIALKDVDDIKYRGRGNPGSMLIHTIQGHEYHIPHLHWTYFGHSFPFFFYPTRDWLSYDKICEWADFSCGDNWMMGVKEQEGASSIITRSQQAEQIMLSLIRKKKIQATPMTTDELIKDQDLSTKLNIGHRLKVWRFLGKKTPIYYKNFQTPWWKLLPTLIQAIFILLSERNISYNTMNIIIKTDYYFRSIPMKTIDKIYRVLKKGSSIFLPAHKPVPTKTKKFKIALIGGYGYNDIGDEAMPHAVRISLKKLLKDDLDLVMLSYNPVSTQESHGEKSCKDFTLISHTPDASLVKKILTIMMTIILICSVQLEMIGIRLRLWPSAREALDEISSADILFNVGGGNINSITTSEMYKKCTTFIIASMLKKPIFLSGQTMGPYENIFHKLYAKYCLNKVNMISFRDKNVSKNRLKSIGVTKPIMFDAADDAITLTGIPKAKAISILEQETKIAHHLLTERMLIFVNLKGSLVAFKGAGRNKHLDNEVQLLAKICNALLQKYNCSIVLLPTDYSEGVDDRTFHKMVYDKINDTENVYNINSIYSDKELIGLISLADLSIGSRYHFNVFAASCCVPFIGIASGLYQMTKLSGLANLCQLPQCYIDSDMEYANFEKVWPHIQKVIAEKEDIKCKLYEQIPSLKNKSLRIVHEAVQYLKTTGQA